MKENITEIWRDINDYEGLYMVSNFGRVKSLPRTTTKGQIIRPSDLRRYESICLTKGGIQRKFLTHRLVAKAFPEICGEWFDGCEVHHKDGNTFNNNAENLKTCTPKENMNDPLTKYRISQAKKGKSSWNKGKHNTWSSKEVKQILNGNVIAIYPSMVAAAKAVNGDVGSISKVCSGKSKEHKGFQWEYK